MSRNVAQIQKMVETIKDAPPPVVPQAQEMVCRLCHRLKADDADWCKYCPGKYVETVVHGKIVKRIVKQADWGMPWRVCSFGTSHCYSRSYCLT